MRLQQIIDQVSALTPQSRLELKDQVAELLASEDLQVIDTHNTVSIIYVFTADNQRYGLKIEHSDTNVIREEIKWYDKAPDHIKQHHFSSVVTDNLAFLVLNWLEDALTIDQLAAAGDPRTMDLYLDALGQDEELYYANPVTPMLVDQNNNFFKDKFYFEIERVKAAGGWYLHDMLMSDQVVLNDVTMPGPAKLVERIQADDRVRDYLSPVESGFIHGDLHAGNLLVSQDKVYMVDPTPPDVGFKPLEYDHGRVHWSMTGWNQIVDHQHTLEVLGDNRYRLEVPVHQPYIEGRQRFIDHLEAYGQRHNLAPGQAYHRAVYSSAMQYLSRGTHVGVPHEALGLHLRGLEQLTELCRQLAEAGIIDDAESFVGV